MRLPGRTYEVWRSAPCCVEACARAATRRVGVKGYCTKHLKLAVAHRQTATRTILEPKQSEREDSIRANEKKHASARTCRRYGGSH